MTIACHLDLALRARLEKARALHGRQPREWPVPINQDDLDRLMAAAGMIQGPIRAQMIHTARME